MQSAILHLFSAAKHTLSNGYHPDVRSTPIKGWQGLLLFLAEVASMRNDTETLLRVFNDLLSCADRMVPADEILRESAEILVHALHAELYVCRVRNRKGLWVTRAANHVHNFKGIPIVAPFLDETLLQHPIMRAVLDAHVRFLISNDLHSLERGGGSLDCVVYKEGYRSRLVFVLRERNGSPPFGLVQLYTTHEHGFDNYDDRFLNKCSRILSLTVSRRVQIARDTLEKAAGAMAHYGNNTINNMRNQAEYCCELIRDMDEILSQAQCHFKELGKTLPQDALPLLTATSQTLAELNFTEINTQLSALLAGTKRMTKIIGSLQKSVDQPHLMHYAMSRDILQLEGLKGQEE
ncbi:MAG: hypothetical protein IK079_04495 [Desulfovibrio sp.]|nr:hypothetical protein [Desulfovibrio sp.]